MTHPTDDDLILLYYGEHAPAERARLEAHLHTCATCQTAWEAIGETLKLADAVEVPEPGEGFERVMWARVSAALPPRRSAWTWRSLVAVASQAALLVAIGFGGWSWWQSARTNDPAVPGADATAAVDAAERARRQDAQERALFAALDGHLEQTKLLLVELMNGPDRGGDFGFERSTAEDLVASGRLYRATAEQTGHRALAVMLEDLEPVLVEVARGPDRMAPGVVRSLRERIDDEGLLFKVRAVATDARER